MSFTYRLQRELIVLSPQMLKNDACPLRTLNSGCSIPPDLSYFKKTFRCQHVQLVGEASADRTTDQMNHRTLWPCSHSSYKTRATKVLWSVVFIIDNKIPGTATFKVAYLNEFTGRSSFLMLSRVQQPRGSLVGYVASFILLS